MVVDESPSAVEMVAVAYMRTWTPPMHPSIAARVSRVVTYPAVPCRVFLAMGKSFACPGASVPLIVPEVVTVSPSVPDREGVTEALTEPLP
ncbi:hypothetical protein AXK57_16090 [Tsukamurella pulmonis]|nr:hypothetical protein AXK57_16090 [Tsukamurella pulmonis]